MNKISRCKDPIKEALRCKKISDAKKGKPGHPNSPEHKLKLLNAVKGNTFRRGTRTSEETRKKLSLARMGNSNRKGKPSSESTKHKISAALKGREFTEEHKRKLSESGKGRRLPLESRKKISKSNKGKLAGDKCPQWKGGISYAPYCPKFTKEFKERVRAFFNYTCQKCGHVWKLGEKRLSVHHVNYQKDACCDPNIKPLFVPVCSGSCHSSTGQNRQKWETFFTNIIEQQCQGKCYLSKDEYESIRREKNG